MYHSENERPASISMAIMRLSRALRRRPPFDPQKPRVMHGAIWLLRVVSSNEGISSRELAELLDIRPSSLTEMLNRSEAEKLIVREKDTQDLRVSRISLTENGKKLLEDVGESWRIHDDFSDILTEGETSTFLALCDKLYNGLKNKYSNETTGQSSGATPRFEAPGPWSKGPKGFHGPGGGNGNPGGHHWPWPPHGFGGWSNK